MKRFMQILGIAWLACLLALPTSSDATTLVGGYIQRGIEALGAGFLPALVTWFFARRNSTERPVWKLPAVAVMLIVIGLAGFGGQYGALRDAGHDVGGATAQAWIGLQAVVFIAGVSLLLLRKEATPADGTDARNS
jgi:hypothetical protein